MTATQPFNSHYTTCQELEDFVAAVSLTTCHCWWQIVQRV